MPRKSGTRARIGDVIQIPIDGDHVGYGQVVATRPSTLLVAVFRSPYPKTDQPPVDRILADDIALLTETFDAKIWNGDWPVVANVAPDGSRFPLPNYKVTIDRADQWHVESYDSKRHRPAKPWELDSLQFRTVVSAKFLQDAFQALHGREPWDGSYRLLEYDVMRRSAEIQV